MPRTSRAPSGAKPPPLAMAASRGSCGANSPSTCFAVGTLPGLVVVEDDAAVLAKIDAVGANAEAEASFHREVKLAVDFRRDLDDAAAPRRLGFGKPLGEAREARPPKRLDPRRAAKRGKVSVRARDQLGFDVVRQAVWMPKRKFVQGMMHDLAAHGVVGKLAERLQRLELQHIAGEDLIRVGDPPLDAGDAELARPCLDGRAGSWRIDRREGRRRVAGPRPLGEGLLGRDPWRGLRRLDQGVEPLQPARRHGRHAVDLDGAGEVERGRPERLGEVVR